MPATEKGADFVLKATRAQRGPRRAFAQPRSDPKVHPKGHPPRRTVPVPGLDPPRCRIPNELVQLQPEPDRQPVGQNPFESRPLAIRVGENRRE
jgi:hypothetical protein